MKAHSITASVLGILLVLSCQKHEPAARSDALVTPRESTKNESVIEPGAFGSMSQDDQEIYLAILDQMFLRWQSDEPESQLPTRHYIKIAEQDAPNDLLAMLRKSGRDVLPGSQYRHGLGVLFSLGAIERTEGKVKVYGGYQYGSLGGEWGPFVLSVESGRWTVLSWKPDVLSSQDTPNKTSILTPDPPPVPAVMTATTSTRSRSLALGQA